METKAKRTPPRVIVVSCKSCGKAFGKNGNSRRVYCSDECNPRLIKKTDCAFCGVTFMPTKAVYSTCCSRKCGWHYNQKRYESGELTRIDRGHTPEQKSISRCVAAIKKVQRRLKKRLNRCILCGEPHLKTSEASQGHCCRGCKAQSKKFGWHCVRSPICKVCQEPRPYGDNTRSGMRCGACEDEHQRIEAGREKAIRRARKANSKILDRDITLTKLAARDDDVCHICEGCVDWDDSSVGNWYPSIDHVIALSNGGDHSWANVKLAHRWCNSVKRDTDAHTGQATTPKGADILQN